MKNAMMYEPMVVNWPSVTEKYHRSSTPVWYSSHCAPKNAENISTQPINAGSSCPDSRNVSSTDATIVVDSASHPWSNSSPSGDDDCVRRACLPSTASSVWYANRQNVV